MTASAKQKITVFGCINSFNDPDALDDWAGERTRVRFVRMACSSMVKDVYLLRAFEAGADAVVVLVCPGGRCRYVEGNIRARKRVARIQVLLDEIGLDGRRLSLHHISGTDPDDARRVMRETLALVAELGPNPAA